MKLIILILKQVFCQVFFFKKIGVKALKMLTFVILKKSKHLILYLCPQTTFFFKALSFQPIEKWDFY
jgi:hypothetical protein